MPDPLSVQNPVPANNLTAPPSVLAPTASITATETIQPAWRTFT